MEKDPKYIDPLDWEGKQKNKTSNKDNAPKSTPIKNVSQTFFRRSKAFELLIIWPITIAMLYIIFVSFKPSTHPAEASGAGWALIGMFVWFFWVPVYWIKVLIDKLKTRPLDTDIDVSEEILNERLKKEASTLKNKNIIKIAIKVLLLLWVAPLLLKSFSQDGAITFLIMNLLIIIPIVFFWK